MMPLPALAAAAGARVAARLMRRRDYPANYTNDLALEGLLRFGAASKSQEPIEFVRAVLTQFRGWKPADGLTWRSNPFTFIHLSYAQFSGERAWLDGWVEDARACLKDVPRDAAGGACFVHRPWTGRIFVDMLQAYAVRMAAAGKLSGDGAFFDEAAAQYKLQRDALRDPETGLWSQGRGWGPGADFIAPLAWLRGQGWVIRGMVECLALTPPEHPAAGILRELLHEFSRDLLRLQDARGMWHQVPHRADSYPETTGTGLITHYLLRAAAAGFLPADPYRTAGERALAALCGFVTRDGTVLNGSFGCGPLLNVADYLYRPAPPGDAHTAGTTLLACSAAAEDGVLGFRF